MKIGEPVELRQTWLDAPDRSLRRWTLLGTIIVVAVLVRLASAVIQGDNLASLPGIHDQISYDALARRVQAGDGFSFATNWWPATRAGEPTAHWSFLYTVYLAAVYAVFGPHPLAARVIQAVVAGVVHPLLVWRLGNRLFRPPVGLAAAALTAVYGYFAYYAGAEVSETFTILAILWSFDLATGLVIGRHRPVATASHRLRDRWAAATPWLLLGLALGLAALLRQVVLLFVPLLFAWLLWRSHSLRAGAALGATRSPRLPTRYGLLLSALIMAALIVPWTIRNALAFGRLVPLNTNAGYVFYWANHPIHGTDFVPILPSRTYAELIPAELRGLDEAALDAALMQRGLEFVVAEPGRYVLLSLSRVKEYFKFWPSSESGLLSNLVRSLSFGLVLPLVLYGVLLLVRRGASFILPDQAPAVVLLGLFVAVYSLVHVLSWALIRYRLPVDGVLVIFASVGIVDLLERFIQRRDHLWARS